ncbi:mRNA splicing factor Cwf18-like [Dillenia turbinata]|uniref:mRNA splicing factor Cwf18-like n=1 Tax=Dillenia turbinata TaxID=194707 RepID=A0AAN8VHV6_9MAGN
MNGEDDSIEQVAAARRERLKALRAAQELLSNAELETGGDSASQPQPQDDDDNNVNMKFRNYLPHDKELQEGKVAPPVLPKFEDPVASAPPQEEEQDPFLNIAPKKPNWDLRRDVQKKLDKLEKRTQKAMFKLMGEWFLWL